MPIDPHRRISEERSTLSGWVMGLPIFKQAKFNDRRKTMNTGTQDEIKGKLHEVKGTVKEKVGQVTNNPDLEAEGKAEHNTGKVQKKVGQVKKVFEK
jgi:uncharacterized protein YjbJ (UPF0337 family)